jgi:hypothetical protein
MPRRNAVLPLVAVAALGLVTGCEKQSPYVTITANGHVVKTRATEYCRPNGRCNKSTDNPVIYIKQGDTLGIDVPRSVADDGWMIQGLIPNVTHAHYQSVMIPDVGTDLNAPVELTRDPKAGVGVWKFTVRSR